MHTRAPDSVTAFLLKQAKIKSKLPAQGITGNSTNNVGHVLKLEKRLEETRRAHVGTIASTELWQFEMNAIHFSRTRLSPKPRSMTSAAGAADTCPSQSQTASDVSGARVHSHQDNRRRSDSHQPRFSFVRVPLLHCNSKLQHSE